MWYRRYIFYFLIAIIVSAAGFLLVVTNLDPCIKPGDTDVCESVGTLPLSLFFISIFFLFTSVFSFLGFLFRIWFHKNEIYLDHMNVSLRQGVLLALVSIIAFVLLLLQVLTWWAGLLLIAIVVLIEFYFIAQR